MRSGADPNSDYYRREGTTPLMIACYNNRLLTAEQLLKWGARVELRDVTNRTALHKACNGNRMPCVRLLMSHNSPTGESSVCVAVTTDWQPC